MNYSELKKFLFYKLYLKKYNVKCMMNKKIKILLMVFMTTIVLDKYIKQT